MRKRLDVSKNPIFSKLTSKPLRKSPIVFNEKVNVALAITPETRVTIRDNPSLILKFLKFVREGRNSATTKAFSFKRLKSPNSFLVETKSQKLYVRKIEQTNKDKPWGNHSYNSALIMSELEKQGVNTVPVQFAYSNLKKGESYIAYDYKVLEQLQTFKNAKKAKTITESEIKEFEDNIVSIFMNYKHKIIPSLKKKYPTREELLFRFYEENQVLFNPVTKQFVVFNPQVDLIKNKLEERKKNTVQEYQMY